MMNNIDDRAVFLSHDLDGMKEIIDAIENLDERAKKILEMKQLLTRTVAAMEATDLMPVNFYEQLFADPNWEENLVDLMIQSLIITIKQNEGLEEKEKRNASDLADQIKVKLDDKEITIMLNEKNDSDLSWLFEDRKRDYRNDIIFLEKELEHIESLKKFSVDEKEKSNDDEKKQWTKNKSEFARYVNEEYKDKRDQYDSLREASNTLFEKYNFRDKSWTKEKCYDLVRKV